MRTLFSRPRRAAESPRLGAGTKLGRQMRPHGQRRHGINYVNIAEVRTLPGLHELNIGTASSVAPLHRHRRGRPRN